MYIRYKLYAGPYVQENDVVFGDNPTDEDVKEWLGKELECLVIRTTGADMASIKSVIRDNPENFRYEYQKDF